MKYYTFIFRDEYNMWAAMDIQAVDKDEAIKHFKMQYPSTEYEIVDHN